MLAGSALVALVGTADPERAWEFYGGTLGLPVVEASDIAYVFGTGAKTLRVTTVERVAPARYTVRGWNVQDVSARVRPRAELGVEMLRFERLEQDEDGVWSAPGGGRIAWFRDPDGNILSVGEMPGPAGAGEHLPTGESGRGTRTLYS